MKTAHEILCEKMNQEMTAFKNSYESMTVTQTYNDWYIIGFKEEFYEMLSCDFVDNQNLEEEIAWLATMDNPLQYMYDYWMDCDGSFNHNWDFLADMIRDAYIAAKED